MRPESCSSTTRDVSLPSCSSSHSAIGAACGVVNGLIVTVARVPSLVVTLGTLYIIRGIDGAWAGGNQVNASMLPESFNKIGYATFLGIPYLGWIAIISVAVATYWMRSFRTARDFYAIGSDPAAARLAGIPVGSRVFLAFVLSGAIAGVAGALWLSFYARSMRSPASATSSRSSRRSSSAASRSSAAAAPSSARRSARCSCTRSTARSSSSTSLRSGARRSRERCCSWRSPSTGWSRCASRRR